MSEEQEPKWSLPPDPWHRSPGEARVGGSKEVTPETRKRSVGGGPAATSSDFAPASAEAPRLDASGRLDENRPCLTCGYDLFGLATTGNCPECGTSVLQSLRGNLLRYSSPAYVQSLHRGVVLILTGIAASVCQVTAGMVVGFAMASSPGAMNNLMNVMTVTDTGIMIVVLAGWWLFSSPDPAIVGLNTGDGPRRTIRITLVIQSVAALISSVLQLSGIVAATQAGVFIEAAVGIVGSVAWIAQFFAAMLYLRWMAPRLPDRRVYDRAKMLMWLGPLLGIMGCLVVPFLVALVLYWNMLNWARSDLKGILADRERNGDHLATMRS